jgi:hypothetical protein
MWHCSLVWIWKKNIFCSLRFSWWRCWYWSLLQHCGLVGRYQCFSFSPHSITTQKTNISIKLYLCSEGKFAQPSFLQNVVCYGIFIWTVFRVLHTITVNLFSEVILWISFAGLLQSSGKGKPAKATCHCESQVLLQASWEQDQESWRLLCLTGLTFDGVTVL